MFFSYNRLTVGIKLDKACVKKVCAYTIEIAKN
jgi:hypothetical protein